MKWNWQQSDWRVFQYEPLALRPLEDQFLLGAGRWQGLWSDLSGGEQVQLQVELMSQEALQTSRIEGDLLDRDSVQSSIKQLLGLTHDSRKVGALEYGISELTVSVASTFNQMLDHAQLFDWHKMLTNGRRDLLDIGRYRTHPDPMQIISGPLERPKVHFEAPPSHSIPKEMDHFMEWFQNSRPDGSEPL
ncbi:MAG: DUF4172 domain-containing protein, partial [Bacteroidota bacterium]